VADTRHELNAAVNGIDHHVAGPARFDRPFEGEPEIGRLNAPCSIMRDRIRLHEKQTCRRRDRQQRCQRQSE
jgi:hypothetical protein